MTRRPKIMFIIDSLAPGGAERSLVELLPHLLELGADPLVVTLKSTNVGFEDDARATGARIHQVEETKLIGRVRALRELIGVEEPDLVHTTLFDSDIAGRLACARLNATVSTSLVNTSYDPARYSDPNITRWKLEFARHIDGWTARHLCDQFHAITDAVKKASIKALSIDPDNVTVIGRGRESLRLGKPSEERRAAVRSRLGLSPDQLVLLNIGRHEYQKGQRHVIDAVRMLVPDRDDVVLLIAGREGNTSAQLRSMIAQHDLGDRVRMLGHRGDIGDLLAAADVFVFPSVYEGLGGALIEAMMMEVPVVASDIPTFNEVLGSDYPLLCAQDPRSIAEAISRSFHSKTFSDGVVRRNSLRVNALLAVDPSRSLARQLVEWSGGLRSAIGGDEA